MSAPGTSPSIRWPGRVLRVRCGPGRGAGDGAAAAPGHRYRAGRGEFPVPGDQLVQDHDVQDGLPGEAGGRGSVADLDQQGGHPVCPFLLARLEVVQAFEVAQQVNPAPGVQGIGQVPVSGVSVPHDDALVAGKHAAGTTARAAQSAACARPPDVVGSTRRERHRAHAARSGIPSCCRWNRRLSRASVPAPPVGSITGSSSGGYCTVRITPAALQQQGIPAPGQ